MSSSTMRLPENIPNRCGASSAIHLRHESESCFIFSYQHLAYPTLFIKSSLEISLLTQLPGRLTQPSGRSVHKPHHNHGHPSLFLQLFPQHNPSPLLLYRSRHHHPRRTYRLPQLLRNIRPRLRRSSQDPAHHLLQALLFASKQPYPLHRPLAFGLPLQYRLPTDLSRRRHPRRRPTRSLWLSRRGQEEVFEPV